MVPSSCSTAVSIVRAVLRGGLQDVRVAIRGVRAAMHRSGLRHWTGRGTVRDA